MFDPKGSKLIGIAEFPEFLKLIIDEEIRKRIRYHEALIKGEVDLEDQVEGNKIFMFNIHQDEIILPIFCARRAVIYREMVESGEIDDLNI